MFKQFFRLTFVTFIWKHYKRIIVSTALLFAFLWFVGYAHSEYQSYANLHQAKGAQSSFFYKWIAQILGVSCYLLFHYLMPSRKQQKLKLKEKAKEQEKELKKASKPFKSKKVPPPDPNEPDPFEQIRKKDKLRSRAEMLVDEK